MNSRKLAGVSAASVGAATAVVALLLGTLSGNAGEGDPRASAYGLSSEGLIPIAPTPYVEAPPDDSKALLQLPSPLGVALLKVEAQAFRSKATAVDVDILGITAKLIEARCDHGRGESSIIGGAGNGKVLPSSPVQGQGLDLSPILTLEFNRQHKDHGKLTVDALVVSLLPADNAARAIAQKDFDLFKSLAPKQLKVPATMGEVKAEDPSKPGAPTVEDLMSKVKSLNPGLAAKSGGDALLEIVISSATCGDDRKEKPKEEAPKPKPVEADLPVTH